MHSGEPQPSVHDTPVGELAINFTVGLAQAGSLSERTRVRIAIYLALHSRNSALLEALRDRGRAAGLNGAEMSANEQGCSHDAMDTVCLRFVKTIADRSGAPAATDLRAMYAVGYSLHDILEVMAQVSVSTLLARMDEVMTSPSEIIS